MCQECTRKVSHLIDFVFGWGEQSSPAWQKFQEWKAEQVRDGKSLPAWERFVTPTPNGQKLWRAFKPEDDPEYSYTKEDYRDWLRDLFQTLFEKACDPDQQFFWAFEQQGGDPTPFLKQLKSSARLQTWGEVIRELGRVYLETGMNPAASYDRETMGGLEKAFWKKVEKVTLGKDVMAALQDKPVGGRTGWRLTIYLLQSCATLHQQNLTFSDWIAGEKLGARLKSGPHESALEWRKSWSKNQNKPWDIPNTSLRLPGVGPNTFEYILRDLAYPGSQHLFKVDSTNKTFVRLTTLNQHAREVPDQENHWREKYWKAIYGSGLLTQYPIAVINIAIYAALSEDYLEIFWENENGLEAYQYLPDALKKKGER